MFSANSYVVPPRPTYAGPCTCVWPQEYARQQVRAKIDQESSAKADAISNPLGAISAAMPERFLPGGFQGVHQRMEAAADEAGKKAQGGDSSGPLDEFGRQIQRSGTPNFRYPPVGSTSHSAMLSTDSTIAPGRDVTYTQAGPAYGDVSPETERGGEIFAAVKSKGTEHIQHSRYNPEREDPRVAEERSMRKAQAKGKLATKVKPDPLGRKGKNYFAKSSETKMRELTAYREDVVAMLHSLIPDYSSEQSHRPVVHRDSLLCSSCMITLTHFLYFSPARFQPYLSETSTRAYLSLVDDAVASSHTQTPMEAHVQPITLP
ncbi:hypothetical protein QFC22_000756 [Naganishia vaughanmartiniae]|uniref:Uncharacterized protein n=1 Tax=Naganishia vaughanmartiniae TaxID=1424756 RepID=A0ACC2XK21_9TREE|nr:hypothetical protein QFC22_000756 [Naganishia vaughanmartiniae]